MKDVVYVYKTSKNPEELEYSVKSLKNIEHSRVIVVGDKPHIEVEHFKPPITRWSMLSPYHDVINKLQFACILDITDDFILMNDDFYALEPTEIPTVHRGTIDNHIKGRGKHDSYSKTLMTTSKYLKRKGIENPLSYELHIPMVFNKQKLADLIEEVVPRISHSSPMLIRSLYGNIYKIGGEQMNDVKTVDSYEGLKFLSSNEKTFAGQMGEYVKGLLCE